MKKILILLMVGLGTYAMSKERLSSQLLPSPAESVTDFNSLSQEINNSNLVLPQTLTTTAETTPANDVIVHPPGPKRKGQLIVTGKIGVGQNETFMLKKCRMESDQIPMKWGCTQVGTTYLQRLNQEISVDEGYYEIKYQSDYYLDTGLPKYVKVKAGRTTRLPLRQIKIPSAKDYTYKVFVDYTDSSIQDKIFLALWGTFEHEERVRQYCGKSVACTAFLGNDYHAMKNILYFNSRGEVNSYYINRDELALQWRRHYINSAASNGPFISVLPGVYGIEFHAADGTITDQYGIRVE